LEAAAAHHPGLRVGGCAYWSIHARPYGYSRHTLELFAEIGVILLMFSVGLEFSIKELLRVKWVALVGGPVGILLSMAQALLSGRLLGWTATQGIVVGSVISVASTMVLTRLLLDRGELSTEHGRVMVAITLVEDLAVVVLIVLLPSFGSLDASRWLPLAKSVRQGYPYSYSGLAGRSQA